MQLRSGIAVVWWMQLRSAVVALIPPLAWEPPYAMDVAKQKQKKKKSIDFLKCNLMVQK